LDRKPTALHTTVPVAASGAFNPLHGVLCILRSLYFCAIGPRSVCLLAMDTHRSSNCSPKPLYSGMRPATPRRVPVHGRIIRDSLPVLWFHSRTLLGTGNSPEHSQPLQSPQCLLESNESRSRHTRHARGVFLGQRESPKTDIIILFASPVSQRGKRNNRRHGHGAHGPRTRTTPIVLAHTPWHMAYATQPETKPSSSSSHTSRDAHAVRGTSQDIPIRAETSRSCSFIRHYCSNRGCLLFLH
jgi:hypothetical protein